MEEDYAILPPITLWTLEYRSVHHRSFSRSGSVTLLIQSLQNKFTGLSSRNITAYVCGIFFYVIKTLLNFRKKNYIQSTIQGKNENIST